MNRRIIIVVISLFVSFWIFSREAREKVPLVDARLIYETSLKLLDAEKKNIQCLEGFKVDEDNIPDRRDKIQFLSCYKRSSVDKLIEKKNKRNKRNRENYNKYRSIVYYGIYFNREYEFQELRWMSVFPYGHSCEELKTKVSHLLEKRIKDAGMILNAECGDNNEHLFEKVLGFLLGQGGEFHFTLTKK